MALIKPMELLTALSGKVCGHSNKYFAVRNGTQYTGTICNPYTGEPSEAQVKHRQKVAGAALKLNQLTEKELQDYKTAFSKQKKYRTLRGFMMSQEMAKIQN